MTELVDKGLFEKLAKTGALKLTPEECISLRTELNEQFTVIRQLEAIPLEETLRPVVHGNPFPPDIRCGLREDEWKPFDDPAEIISQAPLSRDGYIVSPDIRSEKLEIRKGSL